MEKVPQKRPVESSGTRWLILASVAVLVLVGLMLAGMYWKASNPPPLADADSEPASNMDRVQGAPQTMTGR
jgi:cytoskeletal protein RodZ